MMPLELPMIAYASAEAGSVGSGSARPSAAIIWKSLVEEPMNRPTGAPLSSLAGILACSSASQVSSIISRCCGSTRSTSTGDMAKNSASKPFTTS